MTYRVQPTAQAEADIDRIFNAFFPDGLHALWAGMDGVVRMYRLTSPAQADRLATPAGPATTRPSEPGTSK